MMPRIYKKWTVLGATCLLALALFLFQRQYNLISDLSTEDIMAAAGNHYGGVSEAGGGPDIKPGTPKPAGEPYSRMLVMGRLLSEDVDWIDQETMNVNTTIYVVDDPGAEHKVPQNKGKEAMVYLTYIIDHYDDLADTTMFFHPHLAAWHNNILLGISGATTIAKLSDARVAREGYMNARCHLDPGCPDWLHIDRPKEEWDLVKKKEEQFLTQKVWKELHGTHTPVPQALSQPCCAQFAVSRDRIRANTKARYEHLRRWLLKTDLSDEIAGRILEYTWQYLFTAGPEFCPDMHHCYCDGYGICFEGSDGLQAWLDRLHDREAIDEEISTFEKEGKIDSEEGKEAIRKSNAIDEELEERKVEAHRRGEDPRIRAMEVGREWKEGDWY